MASPGNLLCQLLYDALTFVRSNGGLWFVDK